MIVRDGWPFILIGLVVTGLMLLGALRWSSLTLIILAAVFGALTLFTAFFFRNPPRTIPTDPLAVVAPADGKVVAITRIEDHPFIGGPAVRVSIFLSVFDVHVNRVPTSGVVNYVKYNPGKFLAAFHDKASELNEQTEVGMTTPDGQRLTFAQIAGLIARRIVCRLEEGNQVRTGDLFGLIRFGSRTDLTVPADWPIKVKIGDRVTGGETIMAVKSGAAADVTVPQEVMEDDDHL